MITTNLTGNLGNHMWQYAACRSISEKLGYEWGINPSPSHDYHNGMNQMYFMDVDFGKFPEGEFTEFHEKWTTYRHMDDVNITFLDSRVYQIPDGTRMMGDNGALGGLYQCEDYLIDRKEEIIEWFKIKEEYKNKFDIELENSKILLDENTCVINFRGGEYRGLANVILRKEYWRDSINHMLSLNPEMKFVIVTDDPECASSFMPFSIPTIHGEIGLDFYIVNQAKWVILSNSTFGWWAGWLNTKANKIIAPRYWSRHNISDGYWSTGESYTRGFTYLDRDGSLFDYETCKKEALEYYKDRNLI